MTECSCCMRHRAIRCRWPRRIYARYVTGLCPLAAHAKVPVRVHVGVGEEGGEAILVGGSRQVERSMSGVGSIEDSPSARFNVNILSGRSRL